MCTYYKLQHTTVHNTHTRFSTCAMSWNVLDVVQVESARSHAAQLYECMKNEHVFNSIGSCPDIEWTASVDDFNAINDVCDGDQQWIIRVSVYLAYALKYEEDAPSLSQLASKCIKLNFDELEHDWEVVGCYLSEMKRTTLKLVERHFSRSKSV